MENIVQLGSYFNVPTYEYKDVLGIKKNSTLFRRFHLTGSLSFSTNILFLEHTILYIIKLLHFI